MKIVSGLALAMVFAPLVASTQASAQTLHAHEPFAATAGSFLHGLNGGTGFAAPWVVAGFDGNANQFRIADSAPLAFENLTTTNNYLLGGYNNFIASRQLDVAGAFTNQLVVGSNPAVIGRDGTTLWISMLLRREVNDATQMAFSLANADDLANINNLRIGVGYYGASSDNAGQRFWTLLVNNPPTDNFIFTRTAVPITNGVPVLAVLRLQFGATDQIDLFINPTPGGAAPVTPAATRSTTGGSNILFRTIAFWTSANNSNASLDEIRLGDSFADVTPTNPPVIAPGSVQFSAANFSINENAGTASITATRLNGTLGPISVNYATSNDTATAGSDYTAASGTLNWADGDATNKTFTVSIANDSNVESNETVSLILNTPTGGATLGTLTNATLTILDDDATVSLVVSNHSFEFPQIPSGTFSVSAPPPGWSVYGNGINNGNRSVGVLDPTNTTLYHEPPPEGENVGVIFLMDDEVNQTNFANIEAGMQQTLEATLQTLRIYTLRVAVGNITNMADDPTPPFEFRGFPNYRIDLLAGTNVLAADNNSLLPAEGRFLTSTTTVAIAASHPAAGQPLGIRLVNLNSAPGIEVNWDNVRLDSSPIPAPVLTITPEPPSNIRLSWPDTVGVTFSIETSADLIAPIAWAPQSGTPVLNAGIWSHSIPTVAARFFRLRWP